MFGQFKDISYFLEGPNIHSYDQDIDEMPLRVSGGLAVGDVNNDGFQDLLFSLGDNQCLKLLLNIDGFYFLDKTEDFKLNNLEFRSSSPHFFNLNNDAYLDVIVGSVDGMKPLVFLNIDGQNFELQENPEFDILNGRNTITIESVDYNNDGYEDLFLSHWLEDFRSDHFWRNLGNGKFESVDSLIGFYSPFGSTDYSHNAKFIDLNDDTFSDLLLSSDFGTSQVWINNSGEEFIYDETNLLLDENAMGSSIADFDNDGDFDWFVTSIFDDDGILEGNWGGSGNKFYINDGLGSFTEAAEDLGLTDGSWGWGTSFGDFNNDGYQDVVVVNGWPQGSDQFKNDQLKLFISQEAEFFIESAGALGIIDTLQGRGVSVFDYNLDGCLDLVVSNYRGPLKLYENQCNGNNYLAITLEESENNPFGEGCEVELYAEGSIQLREVSNSSNYVSQNPLELHFGLKNTEKIDSLIVFWNDQSESRMYNVDVNQRIHIKKPNLQFEQIVGEGITFPNPSRNYISLVLDIPLRSNENIFVYNSNGDLQELELEPLVHGGKTYFENINIERLSAGLYFFANPDLDLKAIPFIKL